MLEVDKKTIERIKMLDSKIKEILIECKESYGIDEYDTLDISCVDDFECDIPGDNLRFSEYRTNFEISDFYAIDLISLDEDRVFYSIIEIKNIAGDENYDTDYIITVDKILERFPWFVDWFDLEKVLLNILNMVSNDGHFDDDFCRAHRRTDL